MSFIDSKLKSIHYINEDNYNIIPKNVQVWNGKLPFKFGSTFPTADIIERAAISATNKMVYNNDVDKIYNSILNVIPEIDPMYGWQIREIIMNLPLFSGAVNYWVGLIAGVAPQVDGIDAIDLHINDIIENSNWSSIIQSEVRSRFMNVIGAYRVDVDINGKPTIVCIDSKNLLVFMSKEYTTSVEVVVVFNIYKENNVEYIEFFEYHYNGKIVKTTYSYSSGCIGKVIKDKCDEGKAFGGKFEMSPIVLFKHNALENEVYGTDQFRYWSSSIMATMRSLQNVLRLGERTREMIRKVPDSAIERDPDSGANMFVNKGVISYADGLENSPEVAYIVPEINMEAAIQVFEKSVKSVSIDTKLGPVFFDIEKLGTNLSAKSIEAALYPCKIEAKRVSTEMLPSLKELIIKLSAVTGLELKASDFTITMYDGFPKDFKEFVDCYNSRIEGPTPTITLEDYIKTVDKVPYRVAKQKANEIMKIDNKVSNDLVNDNDLLEHELKPTSGDSKINEVNNREDNTLFESQIAIVPNDIHE